MRFLIILFLVAPILSLANDDLGANFSQLTSLDKNAQHRIAEINSFLSQSDAYTDLEKIDAVNSLVNDMIEYTKDPVQYGVADYWATPRETLESGAGDCEDYAILKYYILKEAGVDINRLRFYFIKASNRPNSAFAHMVLAYYDEYDDPILLNNTTSDLLRLSEKPQYSVLYAFNEVSVHHDGGERFDRIQAIIKNINDKNFMGVQARMMDEVYF